MGAELNGDDAVGLRVADRLASLVGQQENLLVLNGGSLPESTSGALRRFHSTLVLFVDAADLGKTAGAIEVLETQRVGGASFSTHGMPL
ncbi:MAG TPA: hydrogenase maturation protease, partial [Anaerolineaceae bacterium]|nr:hydrogenase maturation protease [Anaerolineaceae bacterium]